jgi:hypothetical protein
MDAALLHTQQPEMFEVTVHLARTGDEIGRCKDLIAQVYETTYGVRMAERQAEPDGLIEAFPDRFMMGEVDGELVACAGLYTRHTYVERHGKVTTDEIRRAARAAGIDDAGKRRRYEYTKVVVAPAWGRMGLGRRFIGASHCREFLCLDSGGLPPLLLVCAKLSVFKLWDAVGIRTRYLRPFPFYRNHRRYRHPDDPMESRLIIPERDIDGRWYDLRYPASITITHKREDDAR